jgi:hypothetical protein
MSWGELRTVCGVSIDLEAIYRGDQLLQPRS